MWLHVLLLQGGIETRPYRHRSEILPLCYLYTLKLAERFLPRKCPFMTLFSCIRTLILAFLEDNFFFLRDSQFDFSFHYSNLLTLYVYKIRIDFLFSSEINLNACWKMVGIPSSGQYSISIKTDLYSKHQSPTIMTFSRIDICRK